MRFVVFAVALATCFSATDAASRCLKPHMHTYTMCMHESNSKYQTAQTDTCRQKLVHAMTNCREKVNAVNVEARVREAVDWEMMRCRQARKQFAECQELFEILTTSGGKTKPTSAQQQMHITREMKKSLGEVVRDCMQQARGDQGLKDECIYAKAKNQIETSVNWIATNNEILQKVEEGALLLVGEHLRECYQNASNYVEKMDCMKPGNHIDDACRDARGGMPCSEAFKRKAMSAKSTDSVASLMEACATIAKENALPASSCRRNNMADVKDALAKSTGKAPGDIKDIDALKTILKGGNDRILMAMKTCSAFAEEERATCMADIKDTLSKAEGRSVNSISDLELRKRTEMARAKDAGERMQACMESAGDDDSKIQACHEARKEALTQSGSEPTEDELAKFAFESAAEAAKVAREACARIPETECKHNVGEAIRRALGAKTVPLLDERQIQIRAAYKASLENATACLEAEDGLCPDLFLAFEEFGGYPSTMCCQAMTKICMECRAKAETARAAMKKRFANEAISIAQKEAFSICGLIINQTIDGDKCLQDARAEVSKLARLYSAVHTDGEYGFLGNEREAKLRSIGESFMTCMQAKVDKKTCIAKRDHAQHILNVEAKGSFIAKRAQAELLRTAGEMCTKVDVKACRERAKEQAIAGGMPVNEYAQRKRMAEIKGAAMAFADCIVGVEPTMRYRCSEHGLARYMNISGVENNVTYIKLMHRIETLGRHIANGNATKLVGREKVSVAIQTKTNGRCRHEISDAFIRHLKGLYGSGEDSAGKRKMLKDIWRPSCRVVDGKAEYSTWVGARGMNATDIEEVSMILRDKIQNSIYPGTHRRLFWRSRGLTENGNVLVEAYASQEIVECADGDRSCVYDLDSEAPIEDGNANTACGNGNCCGPGTKFENGKCVVDYYSALANCADGDNEVACGISGVTGCTDA